MGMPASRLTDMQRCSLVGPLPPVPHVGGPIVAPGCPTVLIGKLPAARMTDIATCISVAPNMVAKGSPTVLIGKLPAARIGDLMLHGGSIVTGFPMVLIGG